VQILLGGLITLAGTALIQMLIIPWVQRRTRHLERWERDVIELLGLINEELPSRLQPFKFAIRHWVWARRSQARSGVYNIPDPVAGPSREDLLRTAEAEAGKSWAASFNLTTRMIMLTRRLMLVNRRAPYWPSLFNAIIRLEAALKALNPNPWGKADKFDDAALESAFAEMDAAHDVLSHVIEKIASPVKPPRTYPTQRVRRRLKQLLRGSRIVDVDG
jgi:hypothetical protein